MRNMFITGAGGGIGEAIVHKYRIEGYHVIAPSRQQMNLDHIASIQSYMKNLNDPVDVFIHCAGINEPKIIDDLSEENIQKTFQVNTLSFYTICKLLLPKLRAAKSAHIVAVSSIYGSLSRKGRLAYAASKHALNAMVKTLAIELGKDNIKVNALSPGFIATQLTTKNNSPTVIENLVKNIPLARLGSPDDMAKIAYFLGSEENLYINGQCIIADGGYSIGGFQE